MTSSQDNTVWPSAPVRWWVWFGFAACWSAGLLIPSGVIDRSTGIRDPGLHFTLAKTLHVLAYATFAVLTGWLRVPFSYRWWMLLFLAAHAALGEYLQWSFPALGRTGSVRDVMLDLAAIALGVAVSWKWWRAAAINGSPRASGPWARQADQSLDG